MSDREVALDMSNVRLKEIDFKTEETALGTWKHYLSESGQPYHEFTSRHRFAGIPLVHYTAGRNPESGSTKMAIGLIAIGQKACGVIAIGQLSFGLIAIGQLALGLAVGLGQGCTGLFALGQFSLGAIAGIGQFAIGTVAIGQKALGYYVLAQSGTGAHVWSQHVADPAARQFFHSLADWSVFRARSQG